MCFSVVPARLARFVATVVLSVACVEHSNFAHAGTLVEANTASALDLYGQLKERPGNVFFSPYSISSCLAMAYAGARGETEQQMARVLHFGNEQSRVHAAFGELQHGLNEAQK